MSTLPGWLKVERGGAPLLLSMPHSGVDIPPGFEQGLASLWLARRDADWWVDKLYDFARDMGATVVQTSISRTVIDVNRDPSGASLYPGQATTELCPTTTFDGDSLYVAGHEPGSRSKAERTELYFRPYHAALAAEIARLRAAHTAIVLYDCHSIRSRIPRLFPGELPHFNIGTNGGASCAPALGSAVRSACEATPFSCVTDGRFKGGYITRRYGCPAEAVHAIQMELACRGYMREAPGPVTPESWPSAYDADYAAPMRAALERILSACLAFARASHLRPAAT
jgi:N-formylglutamate deformylase